MITNFKDWLKIQETTTTSNVVSGASGTDTGNIASFKMPMGGGGVIKRTTADLNQYTKCGLGGCPKKGK
jgi:hypothetical protein